MYTVRSFRGQVDQVQQILRQRSLFFLQALEFFADGTRRPHKQACLVTVDHDFLAFQATDRKVLETHYRRNAQCTRQDRHMRCTRTTCRDHTNQVLHRHLGQLTGTDLFTDQDGIRLPGTLGRAGTLQMFQDTPPEIAHIAGPLAQVRVFHGLEGIDVLDNGFTQGARRPVTGADSLDRAIDKIFAAQHHDERIEQCNILCRQRVHHARRHHAHVTFNRTDRGTKLGNLGFDILGRAVRYGFQVSHRVDHAGMTDRGTRRTGAAFQGIT